MKMKMKMKAMKGFKNFALSVCVCACFFALTFATPISAVIANSLAARIESGFGDNVGNAGHAGNADLGRTLSLLNLAGFAGINNSISSSFISYDNSANALSSEFVDTYENGNTHLFNNESIMSMQDLYEFRSNRPNRTGMAGTAVVENVMPLREPIPAGKFRITPRNFSNQNPENIRLLMNNETSFNVNPADFLLRPFPIEPFDITRQDEPVVLILHTHATESLVDSGTFYYYPPFTAERTSDISRNIVLVGKELSMTLTSHNIPVIHNHTIHDYPSFRDSYRRSLETINEYIARYPSIRYVIDVHRDSIIAASGEKFRPVIQVDGQETAQVMIVTGTNNGGAYHPNWRDNLTFSVHLQQIMNERYPMLARPINLRAQRFNQHTTGGSIILEIGSCGSSFDEALRAARLVGESLAELILRNN